jgi:hypothetical protein
MIRHSPGRSFAGRGSQEKNRPGFGRLSSPAINALANGFIRPTDENHPGGWIAGVQSAASDLRPCSRQSRIIVHVDGSGTVIAPNRPSFSLLRPLVNLRHW